MISYTFLLENPIVLWFVGNKNQSSFYHLHSPASDDRLVGQFFYSYCPLCLSRPCSPAIICPSDLLSNNLAWTRIEIEFNDGSKLVLRRITPTEDLLGQLKQYVTKRALSSDWWFQLKPLLFPFFLFSPTHYKQYDHLSNRPSGEWLGNSIHC